MTSPTSSATGTSQRSWERSGRRGKDAVLNRREYYKGLVSLQYSSTARLLAEQAKLVDLQGQLEDLTNQQSITIQALAMEITEDGKKSQQELLDEINQKIAAKKEEIAQQEAIIAGIEEDLDPGKGGLLYCADFGYESKNCP